MKPLSRIATARDLEAAFRSSADGLRAITRRVEGEEADIAQDACLKLIETARREPIAAPTHLLYRMARNLVIDRLRSRALATRLFRSDEADDHHPCPEADPERALLASERLKRALQVIDTMPDRRKEAFLLHRIDGLSYLEIARAMGVSIKAIEKHISAAMLELTRKMHADELDK
ncbi:RNA polymerase sigma factor [Brevundimonas nasdae]|uniref:RNA polymerase sigma factor n=1 Tax=Brevundimonas nasdae TaxID=172043 RepID=A0ABX8TDP8_9CAUL|nr:RNA polymerase sigma factor [Brevundimonas nasdae]QYC09316.1 RNA polymerase sigma factor [Brevundimonas nasdae]QYC15364.1 RNA polymerase sigma factor [Brevundimonas nasdae]